MIDNLPFSLCPIEQGCRLCLIWNNLILLDDSRLLLACYSSTVMASPMGWIRRIMRLVSLALHKRRQRLGEGSEALSVGRKPSLFSFCFALYQVNRFLVRYRLPAGASPGQYDASLRSSHNCYSAVSSRRAMAFS